MNKNLRSNNFSTKCPYRSKAQSINQQQKSIFCYRHTSQDILCKGFHSAQIWFTLPRVLVEFLEHCSNYPSIDNTQMSFKLFCKCAKWWREGCGRVWHLCDSSYLETWEAKVGRCRFFNGIKIFSSNSRINNNSHGSIIERWVCKI